MCLWSHRLGESSVGDINRPACSFPCLPVDSIVHLEYFKRLVNYHISIISEYIQERLIPRCSQMFPKSPLGPRKASSTAFCHQCRCTSSGLSMYVCMYVCMFFDMYWRGTIFKYRCRFRQSRIIFVAIFSPSPNSETVRFLLATIPIIIVLTHYIPWCSIASMTHKHTHTHTHTHEMKFPQKISRMWFLIKKE
jgi:hypothetical protein